MRSTEVQKPSPIFSESEFLVTKDQLSERLAISVSYINKLMVDDGLPYFKIGRAVRYQTSEVLVWLKRRKRP